MPIEDIFSISGRGTVVTGRIERGIVKVGDEIEIVGIRETSKTVVTGVEMFRKLLDQGQAGDNVGILLRGTKKDEVERGQVLARPGDDHAAHEVQGRGLHPDEGGGRSSYAVLPGLSSAVLLPDDGRDGCGDVARGHRDGDAGRQREPRGRADRSDRDGAGRALRDPRRWPYRRRRHRPPTSSSKARLGKKPNRELDRWSTRRSEFACKAFDYQNPRFVDPRDRGHGTSNGCACRGSDSAADPDIQKFTVNRSPARRQEVARAVRDPDAQEAARHLRADRSDRRRAHEARAARRCGRGDQGLRQLRLLGGRES